MKTLPIICCGPGVEPLDATASETLAARFRALSDPTRVAIVNRLEATQECCVCGLHAAFDLSQPTISHHLKVLRDAGLVESSRRGTWAYYRLVPDAVSELRHTLGGWRGSLASRGDQDDAGECDEHSGVLRPLHALAEQNPRKQHRH